MLCLQHYNNSVLSRAHLLWITDSQQTSRDPFQKHPCQINKLFLLCLSKPQNTIFESMFLCMFAIVLFVFCFFCVLLSPTQNGPKQKCHFLFFTPRKFWEINTILAPLLTICEAKTCVGPDIDATLGPDIHSKNPKSWTRYWLYNIHR